MSYVPAGRVILPVPIGSDRLAKAPADAPTFLWVKLAQNCAVLRPNAARYRPL